MKIYLLNVLLIAASYVSGQKLEFTGKLSGLQQNTKVILSDLMGKQFHDTAKVTDGSFTFDTKLPGAGVYVLRVALIGKNPEHRTFYLDAGKVRLSGKRGELKKAMISGDSPYMRDYVKFTELIDGQELFARQKRTSDSAIARAAETGSYEGLFKHMDLVDRMLKIDKEAAVKTEKLARQWVADHPKSDINAYLIYTYLRKSMDDDALKQALTKLSPAAKQSLLGKMMLDKLN